MKSCDFVDSVKTEKANALARYRRFTNITKLFQLIEVFVALALISWSSTRLPFVFKLSGEYVLAFSSYLMNPHVVFIVGNVIVVACYVLSRYTESGNESGSSALHSDGGKYNDLIHRKTIPDASNLNLTTKTVPSRVTELPEIQNQLISLRNEKPVMKTESEVTAETAIKQAAKQIERLQRTQSVKMKSVISMKPRGELRRSVSEKRRSMAVSVGVKESPVKSFQAVDRLSNEEFRIAVEAFISKQQSFLKQQSMIEDV